MHLRSLTLRGFKSFATSTTIDLEPGITCVVGPNGSGKSNVVDAIAWVMDRIHPIRVPEEGEELGLDRALHAESAYDGGII